MMKKGSMTPVRRLLLNELIRKGKSNSPLAVQQVEAVLERLDRNGPRDVFLFNALLDVSLAKKVAGPREQFLQQMDDCNVTPNAETLVLLLKTFSLDDWRSQEPQELLERFRKQYRVKPNWRVAKALTIGFGRVGLADESLTSFRSVAALQGDRAAWSALIEGHVLAGKLSDALLLVSNMHDSAGQRPDADLFNLLLRAASAKSDFKTTESALSMMKRMRIPPNLATIDSLNPASQRM
jgi:pentatricopeptide repeat protein